MNQQRLKVILDSNIWRYLVDKKLVETAIRLTRQMRIEVVMPPSITYESLRTSDPSLRDRLARATANISWTKLPPESFEEAEEYLAEVRRLRPEWLAPNPDTSCRERNIKDWKEGAGRFWARVRERPGLVAQHVSDAEGSMISTARDDSAIRRRIAVKRGETFDDIRLSMCFARPATRLAGWRGEDVEEWRLTGMYVAAREFRAPPYSDWLHPMVMVPQDQEGFESWVRFWLYDIEAARMPRWWIRRAFERLASLRRTSSGTPCDIQLSTYLVSADVILTADSVFCELIEKCRPESPVALADSVRLVPGENPGVSALDAIEQLGSRSKH